MTESCIFKISQVLKLCKWFFNGTGENEIKWNPSEYIKLRQIYGGQIVE